MTIQVLRTRVDDDVRAVLEWSEVHGAGERRIDDERQTVFLGEMTGAPEVEHAAGGIHRRLDEDRARLFPQAPPPPARLRGIYERDAYSHRLELLGEEAVRSAVDPGASQEVIAGAQQGE